MTTTMISKYILLMGKNWSMTPDTAFLFTEVVGSIPPDVIGLACGKNMIYCFCTFLFFLVISCGKCFDFHHTAKVVSLE